MKIILQSFIFFFLLMNVAYGGLETSHLEKLVSQLENDLSHVGYDPSKLPPMTVEKSIAILSTDYQLIYPRQSDLSETKDYDGRYFIKEIVRNAMKADGKMIQYQYRWQNTNFPQIFTKLFIGKYIKSHELIVGASEVVDLLDRKRDLRIEGNKLIEKYFYEAEKKGVDHPDAREAYIKLQHFINSLPDKI